MRPHSADYGDVGMDGSLRGREGEEGPRLSSAKNAENVAGITPVVQIADGNGSVGTVSSWGRARTKRRRFGIVE